MPDDQAPPKRDVRVDRIGFANELAKQYVDPLKDKVKAAHPAGTRLEADYFEATIAASTSTEIPASKWLRLHEAGEIDRAQFLSAISVSPAEAKKILSERDYKKIAKTGEGSPRLNVRRRPGVEIALIDALNYISATVASAEAAAIVACGEDAARKREAA
jgi:hypothetical protein